MSTGALITKISIKYPFPVFPSPSSQKYDSTFYADYGKHLGAYKVQYILKLDLSIEEIDDKCGNTPLFFKPANNIFLCQLSYRLFDIPM